MYIFLSLIPSYSLNKYLLSIIYALDIGLSTRIHEKGNFMAAAFTGLPVQYKSRIEQTEYYIVG